MIGNPLAFPCLQYEYPFVVSSQDITTTSMPEMRNVTSSDSIWLSTLTTLLSSDLDLTPELGTEAVN